MKQEKKLINQVVKLYDIVHYQEGDIVSRTIMDVEAGTVTLFAFDEGQGLSERNDTLRCVGLFI